MGTKQNIADKIYDDDRAGLMDISPAFLSIS